MVEHRFCKPGVVGSTPTGSLVDDRRCKQLVYQGGSPSRGLQVFGKMEPAKGIDPFLNGQSGQVAERPMASDCKSDGYNLRGFESLPAQMWLTVDGHKFCRAATVHGV